MDHENETRPLLHDFESETWRSRARKRCIRIPSEAAITGLILGVFFIVVTLLIVLENMETTKKDDISVNKNLLASPNFNQKLAGKTWQEHKRQKLDKANKDWNIFPDISESTTFNKKNKDKSWQDEKQRKFDKVNKGWKILPDVSELTTFNKKNKDKSWQDEKQRKFDKVNKGWKILPDVSGRSDSNLNEDMNEIVNLMQSPMVKKEKIDEGWRKLSKQGWEDYEIRKALLEVLIERKKELNKTEDATLQQSPMNLEELWDRINESWEEKVKQAKMEREYRRTKRLEEAKKRMGINDAWKNKMTKDQMDMNDEWKNKMTKDQMDMNDEWKNKMIKDQKDMNDGFKNKMTVLQSPKAAAKKIAKDDDGWKTLSEQGWKNKNIEEALIDAWKEKEKEKENLLMSPMNLQTILEKATDFLKNFVERDLNNKDIDKDGSGNKKYLESPTNFDVLKMVMETSKKYKKDYKKRSDDKEEPKNEDFSLKIEDLIDYIFEKVKKHQKDNKDENYDKEKNGTNGIQYSSVNFDDFLENIITEAIKDNQIGNEVENQKSINDAWKNKMNVLQTTKTSDQKWKNINDHWKTLIEHERISHFGKNDDTKPLTSTDGGQEYLMSSGNMKWKKVDGGWKKLSENGWKNKSIKEAVDRASTDGDKLLQSAMGYNDMKWKKVNDGYKKTFNKSLSEVSRCPLSRIHKTLYLQSAKAPPINCALIAEEVRRKFGQCIDLSFLPRTCKPSWRTKCFSTYKYRKIDGTCNNKIHPTWGKSSIPFVRMIAPDYADGVSELRKAKDGGNLPNARYTSTELYSKRRKPDGDTTLLFLYFGLIVDHDMIQTAQNPDSIPCCELDVQENNASMPTECLQIDVSSDDPFYGPKNVKCLNLLRSYPVNGECGGRREQLNEATSFLDASAVYGSKIENSKHLRTFSCGLLRTQLINKTPFMSNSEDLGRNCGTLSEPLKCFEAGDSRVNMLVDLTVMHTIWYREHNRIALELHKINRNWTDEVIYQEAKRIVAAEIQHITYNEFLNILLAEEDLELYNLKIDESKVYDMYDDTVDASVFNVFGAVAFRFGHSLVPDSQKLIGSNNSSFGEIPVRKTYFSANLLYHEGLDLLLRGAATQRTFSVDSYISPEIREHLFQPAKLDYGFDLAAIGIQRGRDHGIPSYIQWRSVCGLSDVKAWDDLYEIMGTKRTNTFKRIYRSVEDIDLITGALAEHHKLGSLLGPTHTCLIGRQFKKTRTGDRFWFEIQNKIGSFTKGQLKQLYKSNMARIVCDNSDNINEIQKNPFKAPSLNNPLFNCDEIEKMDLSEWAS